MATEASDNRLYVLVVSDDPHVREEARYGFSKGSKVSFANDAREAWPLLRGERPSVVVVDMQTGNAGGYALARSLSESSHLAGVPVLILLERSQDDWLARTAGASMFRVKPLRPGELVTTTQELAQAN